ncbi:MAG TPA: hypothetical protein DFR83_22555 [Deltaproteobacteria bacterium]|nr:hypothetical protein [Deltaproteobacteria bacterium]
MLQAIQRWLRPIFSSTTVHLVVEGRIVEAGTHQPRTRLGPEAAPTEAYFTLELASAKLSDGSPQRTDQVVPPEFSGPESLLEQFSVGDCVRITTTTRTGRQIQSIEAVPQTGA